MQFFASAITTLQTLVIALGAGLGVWGVVNLLEGYGSDNPGAKAVSILTRFCCQRQSQNHQKNPLLFAVSQKAGDLIMPFGNGTPCPW